MKHSLLLQYAAGAEFSMMARDMESRHAAYCEKWRFDREVVMQVPARYPIHPNWFKIDLLIERLASREYETIVYIDADVAIADFSTDLRTALPPHAWLGMVVHPYAWSKTIWHWNAGVLYIKSCAEALIFFAEVKRLAGSKLDSAIDKEQGVINHLLMDDRRLQQGFVSLPHVWNGNAFNQPQDDVIVAAWHGSGFLSERRQMMRQWAEQHPYGS